MDKNFEKRYFDEMFGSMNRRFDFIDKHLEKINGRVCKLEETCNEHKVAISDLKHVEKDVEEMRKQVNILDKELLEVRFFKKYPKVFVGVLVVSVLLALGMTGFVAVKTVENSNSIEEVEKALKVEEKASKTGRK